MPNVNGKKFPYTKEGIKAAGKAQARGMAGFLLGKKPSNRKVTAKKNAVGGPKQLKNNVEQRKTRKMAPKKSIGKYGKIGRA